MRPDLAGLLRDSLVAPRLAAERLLGLRLALAEALGIAALVAVIGALLVGTAGGGRLEVPWADGVATIGPLGLAALSFGVLVLNAAVIARVGRALGGRGSTAETLVVVSWLQIVALAVEVAWMLAVLLLPPLAGIVALAGLVLLLWTTLSFVRALHRFDGFGRTLATLLLAGLGFTMILSLAISLLGGLPDA